MNISATEAKRIWKYRNQWVALAQNRVVAHGENLKEVRDEVERKKVKGYVFHFVPARRLALYAV